MSEEKFDPDQGTKCDECGHDKHDPRECKFIYFYARGPNDPPGNQGCLCGYVFSFQGADGMEG